jgi:hypothetical protein
MDVDVHTAFPTAPNNISRLRHLAAFSRPGLSMSGYNDSVLLLRVTSQLPNKVALRNWLLSQPYMSLVTPAWTKTVKT